MNFSKGLLSLTFLTLLATVTTVNAESTNDLKSEFYLSKCNNHIWTEVVVVNFNSDKSMIKRVALTFYNSELVYQGTERNNWYASGRNFPFAIFGDSQELKLESNSGDAKKYSFYGIGTDDKFHSENVYLNFKDSALAEIIADYEKRDSSFSAKDYLKCSVEKKLTALDMLNFNHMDIFKYPLGGDYSSGRKVYKVRYSDLGFYAQPGEIFNTENSWNYVLPGIYTLKISKLIQKPFRKPVWTEIYKKELRNPKDFIGTDSFEFNYTITDKFYPEDMSRIYPGGDNPATTIVIDKKDWESDLKVELQVIRNLDGFKNELTKSLIINSTDN